jgi:hypothetical protein
MNQTANFPHLLPLSTPFAFFPCAKRCRSTMESNFLEKL